MTQQKDIFLGSFTPQKTLRVRIVGKGKQGAPILLPGVSLRTPDTTVSLCPRMSSRDWRLQKTKWEIQKRGCVPKYKIVIASPIHWQPLTPGDTKTLHATLETSYLRSTLAWPQSCPRLSRELPTSYMLHCVTFYILLGETTSYRLTQPGSFQNAALSAFWGTAEGSSNREFLYIMLTFTWNHQYGHHAAENTKFTQPERNGKKIMMKSRHLESSGSCTDGDTSL